MLTIVIHWHASGSQRPALKIAARREQGAIPAPTALLLKIRRPCSIAANPRVRMSLGGQELNGTDKDAGPDAVKTCGDLMRGMLATFVEAPRRGDD